MSANCSDSWHCPRHGDYTMVGSAADCPKCRQEIQQGKWDIPAQPVDQQSAPKADPDDIDLINGLVWAMARGDQARAWSRIKSAIAPTPREEAKPAQAPNPIGEIIEERDRQIRKEGWTAEHDDAHGVGELSTAAACYALYAFGPHHGVPIHWPWDHGWWKPKSARRNLVRAAALIVAEIESCDRNHAWPGNQPVSAEGKKEGEG